MLCEPYLLDPTPDGVHVVWHTEEPGAHHAVLVGPAVAEMSDAQARAAATGPTGDGPGWRRFSAGTTPLSRTREDQESAVPGRAYRTVTRRPVYRQLATVTGLAAGRTPYRVVSGGTVTAPYTLAPAPPPDQPVRLLLTSDHQLKPMVPANLAKVAETAGVTFDGVLMAGDLVNAPDRASEWFDTTSGPPFFRTFRWILPHSPIYPAIGNHEVMGRWSDTATLDEQFNDPQPGAWDVTTYEELFPYPRSESGGPRWWSRTIGDVHVICLFATQVWRTPHPEGRGKFQEALEDVDNPDRWGHGQFIFEPIKRGSAQFAFLEAELASPAARRARYRVVMFHHPSHGLGNHSVPPYTDPVRVVTTDPKTIRYEYPLADDHILRDVEPLLSASGVHLVLNGHSHVWNRFRNAAGVHWLETSNVGNSYGAYHETSGLRRWYPPGYVLQGDPGGLEPIVPTVAPLVRPDGVPLPFVASNEITVFTLLDSAAGVVRSYRHDTREPRSPAVLFDEFPLA